MEEAHKNANTKGHSVIYREKILPALSQNKNFKNNSAAMNVVSEETKKKFLEQWKATKVDIAADDARRSKIFEVVKPLIGTEPTKAVVDIEEVKAIIGETKVCWGCLSSTCLLRQNLSGKMTSKKLVNRHCTTRKTVLGDKYLTISFQTKVGKDNQVAAYDGKKKNKKRKFKGKLSTNSAAIIKNLTPTKQFQQNQ